MILHLDMDAFFASVEQLDNPALRGKPVIIGGGERGVVATASYEARIFGIHSAMPAATARKLCPHGIFMRGRFQRYRELSGKVMACLRKFSPIVQSASIDEAYIDVCAAVTRLGSPEAVALEIQKGVYETTGGLTCSIGIAPVKFLAKICSDMNKPGGIYILRPEEVCYFLGSLPVGKLPGVGKRMRENLAAFGITTVGQLRQLSRDFMESRYGKWGLVLCDRASGIDPRQVHENLPAKSESCECTFKRDISDREQLAEALARHAERIGRALCKQGVKGRTITVKIKFCDFRLITRSRTLENQTDSSEIIYQVGLSILSQTHLSRPVRLIGLGISGFGFRAEQLPLPGLPDRQLKTSFMAAKSAIDSRHILPEAQSQ